MKKTMFVALVAVAVCAVNCTKEEIEDMQRSENNIGDKVLLEEAANKARTFIQNFAVKTRGISSNCYVSSVYTLRKSYYYSIARGGIVENNLPDTLAYIVNFSDDEGFVIVSADKHVEEIIAYIDKGSFTPMDNVEGTGFSMFLHDLPNYINYVINLDDSLQNSKEIITRGDLGPGGGGLTSGGGGLEGPTIIDSLFPPLLKTKWGQGTPYNMLCPIREGNRAPTGCMATSLAQIMSYYKWPVICEYVDFGWDEMQTDSAAPSSYNAKYYIAELMLHIGHHLNMVYKNNVSESHTADVGLCLDTMNYSHTTYLPYNFFQVKDNIIANRPVHIDGADYANPDTTYAHAWVIDGGMVRSVHLVDEHNVVVGRTHISRYVHCNWGSNGSFDGYFLSGVFDPNQRKYVSSVTRANYSTNNAVYYDIIPDSLQNP